MKRWWLSFCDTTRPAGSQFLGAAIVNAHDMIGAIRAFLDSERAKASLPGFRAACVDPNAGLNYTEDGPELQVGIMELALDSCIGADL